MRREIHGQVLTMEEWNVVLDADKMQGRGRQLGTRGCSKTTLRGPIAFAKLDDEVAPTKTLWENK